MFKKTEYRHEGSIMQIMNDQVMRGDAFVFIKDLNNLCGKKYYGYRLDDLKRDVISLFKSEEILVEGDKLYLPKVLKQEDLAAKELVRILQNNMMASINIPEEVTIGNIHLTMEQRDAVLMSLTHRLSMIFGGAGTGKTTLIKAIVEYCPISESVVLCAPTGKAAQNLSAHTGKKVSTVHSLLGLNKCMDYTSIDRWSGIEAIVADEASMLTLEMLSGILAKAPLNCRIVLVGDYQQLEAVGAGNVLPNLIDLGIPYTSLQHMHRQDENAIGLSSNVACFSEISSADELLFDSSFQFINATEAETQSILTTEASRMYLGGENVQVLSPVANLTELSVKKLNKAIQPLANPTYEGTHYTRNGFFDNDRVIITRNDKYNNCSNGDVGLFNILGINGTNPSYGVRLSDGRMPT